MKTALTAAIGFAAILVVQQAAAQVIFYSQEGLHGRAFTANGPIENLDQSGFNDRASSAVVERGQWEVCDDAYFRGHVRDAAAGRPSSDRRNGQPHFVGPTASWQSAIPYAPTPPAPAYSYPHHGRSSTRLMSCTCAPSSLAEQRCWVEQQQVVWRTSPMFQTPLIGGVVGGVLGHRSVVVAGTTSQRRSVRSVAQRSAPT